MNQSSWTSYRGGSIRTTGKSRRSILSGTSIETIHDPKSALRLWRAVISQAFADAASEKRHHRISVATWLLSRDFDTVCGLAMLNPVTVKKVTATILAETPERGQKIYKKLLITIDNL